MRDSFVIQSSKKLTRIGEGMFQLRKHAGDWLGLRGQLLNHEFSLGDIPALDRTNWDMVADAKDDELKNLIHRALAPDSGIRLARFQVLTRPDEVGRWEQLDGKIRIDILFNFDIPTPNRPPLRVDGTATLESIRIIDPATINADSDVPNWILARIVFTAARRINPTKL
jgi:hypothetical protein